MFFRVWVCEIGKFSENRLYIGKTTGKPITVETDGSKITYFDDGEGTTCNTNKICSSGNCICDPSKECL